MKTISLLSNGFNMDDDLSSMVNPESVSGDFRSFLDQKGYSQAKSNFTRRMLKTLEELHDEPVKKFYNGLIANRMSEATEGHLDVEDIKSYKPIERDVIVAKVGVHQVRNENKSFENLKVDCWLEIDSINQPF